MKKIVTATIIGFAVLSTSPAMAGSTTLKKDCKSYSLKCNNGGCFLTEKISLFKSGPKKKLGPGGRSNFLAWKKKLEAQGYK